MSNTGWIVRAAEPQELAIHWRTIDPLFAAALPVAIGRFEPVDLLLLCLQGQFKPWLAVAGDEIRAVMLTSLIAYPRRKCCSVFLVSGHEMSRWLGLWTETIERYARAEGCDHLEGQGRPGWERVTGAKKAAVLIVKDL